MIDYIRGILTVKETGRITVETHGVGYDINIPLSTYEKLPAPGAEALLQIHYHVREDAHKLYGFYSAAEREMFRQLINISKIGPKVAMSVLSGVSINDLIQSINQSDPARLQKIPGVGAKTAQRLVLELKGKLAPSISGGGVSAAVVSRGSGAEVGSVRDEVYAAMISLGYNEKQVVKALERAGADMAEDAPVEAWIRKVLQVI